eukprot:TRINITY_DN12257_c0_g1_i3.p1 TRINITY_DN12257_c0_g1~~TRINITY_DN12257_c0_g1_i3.p1  ORF type:complete len:247 (-),score=43.89 TRINITY_DN12257_c0_g1_i3:101-841(-)
MEGRMSQGSFRKTMRAQISLENDAMHRELGILQDKITALENKLKKTSLSYQTVPDSRAFSQRHAQSEFYRGKREESSLNLSLNDSPKSLHKRAHAVPRSMIRSAVSERLEEQMQHAKSITSLLSESAKTSNAASSGKPASKIAKNKENRMSQRLVLKDRELSKKQSMVTIKTRGVNEDKKVKYNSGKNIWKIKYEKLKIKYIKLHSDYNELAESYKVSERNLKLQEKRLKDLEKAIPKNKVKAHVK